jgi:signal transduction histidine kinase
VQTRTASDTDQGPTVSPPQTGERAPVGRHSPWPRMRLGNWRVPVRLVALIAIPTAVAVLLAGLRVSSALGDAAVFERIEQLAVLGDKVTALVQSLQTERDTTAKYVTSPSADSRAAMNQGQRDVDAAAKEVRKRAGGIDSGFTPVVRAGVQNMLIRINSLPALRQTTSESRLPALPGIEKYSQFIGELLDLDDRIAQGSTESDVSEAVRTLGALSRAKEQSSREQAILTVALNDGRFAPVELDELQNARAARDSFLDIFSSSATVQQRQLYEDTVAGPEIDRAETVRLRAIRLAQASPTLELKPMGSGDVPQWFDDMTKRIDRLRIVEAKVVSSIVDRSRELKDRAQRGALIDAVFLCLVLLLVLGATIVVARSLVRPLRRLRTGALDVAGSRLPDFVRRLREPDVEQVDFDVEPIDVDTTDEIGEVARAFDEVHREAVRLASNEAMLRGNVNAMFVNLSRRSQSLIERQLRLIEDLEQSEQDSGRLDSLFKLDHLATRMRRNGENLLVLGGQEQTRRWNKPVPLVDIVRASLSEVEQYERITLRIQDEVSVNGRVVNDLVHLVAELVENATAFSPEHTKVAVSGHLLSGGGAMLQISDSGVGMSPEELEEANWRLANPPTIDVSVSRRMGLFVVGRLAQRHGIRVELRAALSGGLTAFVILAPNTIMQDAAKMRPQRLDALSSQPLDRGPTGQPPIQPIQPVQPLQPPTVRGEIARPSPEQDRPPVPDTPREPLRSSGTGLPKRKPAPTSPPGRGPGSTAPSRSSRPQGVPPSRSGPPPGPPPEPPMARPVPQAQPQPAGPAFGESPAVNENNGRSPIFEAMQSEWFQRRKTGSMSRAESSPPREWSSPGDEGWRAAETVREPATGGQTSAGLPKRVPGSNRIPGSVGAAPRPAPAAQAAQSAQPVQPAQPTPRPEPRPPQAEAVRNRFASFQQGVRKGRAAIRPEDDERENQ